MNSSDRSIAILDIAIRRRFAFIKLWPQTEVVQRLACSLMQQAFQELLSIFIEYASDDALNLMPGHAYFLEKDQDRAIQVLQTTLYPLLEEYLAAGVCIGIFRTYPRLYAMAKKSLTSPILTKTNPLIFECIDSDEQRLNATRFIRGDLPRDPQAMAARLANQFIDQNRGILNNFDVQASQDYDGQNIWLVLRTGIKAGAFPLLAPTSGRPEYGMVIKPRFEWAGIGSMLAQMGWRITPTLLKLPLIPGTERKVPPWVLSSIVLIRVRTLLDQLERRFEVNSNHSTSAKGYSGLV